MNVSTLIGVIPKRTIYKAARRSFYIVQTNPNCPMNRLSTWSWGHYSHSWFTIISMLSLSLVDMCPLPRCLRLPSFGAVRPSVLLSSWCGLRSFCPIYTFIGDVSRSWPSSLIMVMPSCKICHWTMRVKWSSYFSKAFNAQWGFAVRKPCGIFVPHPKQQSFTCKVQPQRAERATQITKVSKSVTLTHWGWGFTFVNS
jgi:hypothetical protein